MSQYQKVRIRLRGCNEFQEKFPASSVVDAVNLAKCRYPDAQHISWVGSCRSDEDEAKSEQFFADYKRKVDENNERVFGVSGRNADQGPVSGTTHSIYDNGGGGGNSGGNVAGSIADMGLVVGGFVVMLIIGFIVMFAPIIAFVGTGKLAYGQVKKLNIKTIYTIILTLALSTGAGAGTFKLQQEYLPDVAEYQQEKVEQLFNSVKGGN